MIDTNKQPDFEIFGVLDLEKSVSAKEGDQRIVFGEISNTDKDEQGESLIQKSLDFSYFDTNGVIKYEHYPKHSPENIIGKPLKRWTDDNRTLIKGVLLKGHKCADETWSLIKSINELNKSLPADQQFILGWSVEGDYGTARQRHGGSVRGAKIINVVITPNPILKSTYLKMAEEHNTVVFKSLCATPVNTDIVNKVGGDAISGENIDSRIKQTTDDKSKKKKKRKEEHIMKSFESYDEAVEHFVELGKSEDEAAELAKSLFPDEQDDQDNNITEELGIIKSTLGDIKDKITGLFKGKQEDDPDDDLVIEDDPDDDLDADDDLDDDLDKSETVVDATKFLKSLYNTNRNIMKSIQDVGDAISSLSDVLEQSMDMFNERIGTIEKAMTITDEMGKSHTIAEGLTGLMKSVPGYTVNADDISNFNIALKQADIEVKNFGELGVRLEKGVASGKIDLNEQSKAEKAFLSGDFKLVKSILKKCEEV